MIYGIQNATDSFIYFMDADDVLKIDGISKVYQQHFDGTMNFKYNGSLLYLT